MFPYLVKDVGKVYGGLGDNWRAPDYFVLDDPGRAQEFLRALVGGDQVLAVDIEVAVDKDTAFDHPNRYGMLCVGIGYAPNRVAVLSTSALDTGTYDLLGDVLRSNRVVAQNGKFDLAGLFPHIGAVELWFDTMLASYVFDERPGIHGLKIQAQEYLGAPDYAQDIAQYVGGKQSYANIPSDILYRYNAYDVACTYALYQMYERRLDHPNNAGLRRVHEHLVAASNQLMYMELNGIAVDRDYLNELQHSYLGRIEELEQQLDGILAGRFPEAGHVNPRSPIQVKKALEVFRIRVASTNEDTLKKVLEVTYGKPGYEDARDWVTTLLKHRRESKLYGTYVKGIRQRLYRGRVYPTFLLHGTTTGRLACRNPNLQNVPRESSIRRMFVPAREGWVYVQADYSQAELRVLSYLAGDNYFRGIFNGGDRDLFDELTSILYPSARKDLLDPAAWKELRIRVKAYVYGLAYGRTEYSIAEEYGISVEEARRGMAAFFRVIPEIVRFREDIKRRVINGEDLVTPFGRRRRFPLITEENFKSVMNEALAFPSQSTASDICLQAFTWARKELKGIAYLRNLVHDSILAECAPEDAEFVAGVLNRCMVDSAKTVVGDYVLFATDHKIGTNWGAV
jgi:DNA polymerase-1